MFGVHSRGRERGRVGEGRVQNSVMNMLILKYLLYSPVAICVWSSGLEIDFGSKPHQDSKVIEMDEIM